MKKLLYYSLALQVAGTSAAPAIPADNRGKAPDVDDNRSAAPSGRGNTQVLTRKPGSTKPNILLIMVDDMGYSDIGCYGGEIDTPNIDRLAANGIRFTQFYNTARCCPTRAALLTGLYSHQAGVGHMNEQCGDLPGYQGELNNNSVTIAEVLHEAGYGTYQAGKWHIARNYGPDGDKHNWPCQRGFDHSFGNINGYENYFKPTTLQRDNEHVTPPDNFYYTDAIADNAVNFIDEHETSSKDKPFFMYVAFTAPHWPLHAPEEEIAAYKGRFSEGWDALREKRLQRQLKMGIIDKKWALSPRDSRANPWEDAKNKEWQQRRMEVYAAQITRMDKGVGRIVDQLKKSGQLDNTLIFFLSDNGGCAENLTNNPAVMPGPANTHQSYGPPWANLSNTPFRLFKHWEHEGGISTPLIVHWPARVKARGELRKQPGHLIDIMATCVDVSGAKYPEEYNGNKITPMEGKSLTPAFANKRIDREALYWEHEGNRAIRAGKWKLVAQAGKPWELYDLEADRTELLDLSAQNPDKTRELSEMWDKWAQRCNVLPMQPWVKKPKTGNPSGKTE